MPEPRPVVLRVWGGRGADAQAAEQEAREQLAAQGRPVAEVDTTVGRICPIPRRDGRAAAEGRGYRRAWAAYPLYLDLKREHAALAAALERLGVEAGPYVLAIWRDRRIHGIDPLPAAALRALRDWAERLLGQSDR